ncbi:MAG: DUF1631 domain-containing protein [Pseudomonadales bacterium]|nr:DUF1631 domain-containing protein [Pseudomonadales bacterium]
MALPTLKTINAALKGYYTPPKPSFSVFDNDALKTALYALPGLSKEEHIDTILTQIQTHHTGISLQPGDHATIAFIDDCVSTILGATDLGFKIEAFIRDIAPLIAVQALEHDLLILLQPQKIFNIIELVIQECIGWNEDLGVLGDQYMEKIATIINGMVYGRLDVDQCNDKLIDFFAKEQVIYDKMEDALCAKELEVLVGQKGKYYAAELLNKHMADKPLSLFIICMLQGSWYELLQQVFIHCGQKSESWQNISQLTETLTCSLQTNADKEETRQLAELLPSNIIEFVALTPFEWSVEDCMEEVKDEYAGILSGDPSPACDFELLETDATMKPGGQGIQSGIQQKIAALKKGQWFLFDDKNDSNEKIARIRLILNWQDTDRLLFTNHNRRKIMNISYHEFAGYLSSNTIRQLDSNGTIEATVKAQLVVVIRKVQAQKKREIQAREAKQLKTISRQYRLTRRSEILAANEGQKQQAKEKLQRANVLVQKATKKKRAAEVAVAGLNIDAWVKLPVMEGTLTPCRLAAIIPGADKYIFTNRVGIKVADYSARQLSQMIVTENSEILDTGVEFENVLESVISGLRANKEKSFDALSGTESAA